MRRPIVRTTIAAATAALVLAACGGGTSGGPAITDQPGALEAMADSLAGSWTWSGQIEVAIDDDALRELARLEARPDAPDGQIDQTVREMREYVDGHGRFRTVGALAEDGSFRIALELDDTALFDIRNSLRELFAGATLTPDLSFLVRFDIPAIVDAIVEFWEFAERAEVEDGLREMREGAQQELQDEPGLLAVVLALLDGRFGGLAGQVDLEALGVAEEDLPALREHFAREVAGEADRATMLALLDEALTVRDFQQDGSRSVATVDVHPRDAAFAIYDLFDDAEREAGRVSGMRPPDEDLPETLRGVATLVFDGPWLVEVRTNVIAIVREMADHVEELQEDESQQALEALADAQYDVVFGFGDHGEVDTVVDVDATTVPWDDVFESWFGWMLRDAMESAA